MSDCVLCGKTADFDPPSRWILKPGIAVNVQFPMCQTCSTFVLAQLRQQQEQIENEAKEPIGGVHVEFDSK